MAEAHSCSKVPETLTLTISLSLTLTLTQILRYRCYYDANIQLRWKKELWEEEAALNTLSEGLRARQSVSTVISNATAVLQGEHPPLNITMNGTVGEDFLHYQVHKIAALLFQSIKMQLSVSEYFAEYTVRGANLDTLDLPLNNAPYLLEQLAYASSLPASEEDAKWAVVQNLSLWSDPGDGGFYDDLGGPAERQPHLVVPLNWTSDPDYYTNPLNGRAIAYDVHWVGQLLLKRSPQLHTLFEPHWVALFCVALLCQHHSTCRTFTLEVWNGANSTTVARYSMQQI